MAVGLAVALQVPLFWAFAAATEGADSFTCADLTGERRAEMSDRRVEVLTARCAPTERRIQARLAPEAPPLPPDAQVVEVPDMPEIVDPPPVETKYLADRNTRTERETRSEVVKRSDVKGPGRAPLKEPAATQSEKAQSDKPTTTPKEEPKPAKEPEVADVSDQRPETPKGTQRPSSVMDRSSDTSILLPSTSSRNAIANMQALSGDFTSTDHLPDMERGKSTVLNANAYRFADFFNMVKRQVERHWRPSDIYMRRDPSGQLYGVKDRYTVLRVELDTTGKVRSIVTTRPSGLDFMDEEAKRAMNAAAPFLNPPRDLAREGVIRFEFGFYFEITGGKYRFNWRRL